MVFDSWDKRKPARRVNTLCVYITSQPRTIVGTNCAPSGLADVLVGCIFMDDNFLKKLPLWEIGNIWFNGLAKPIDAFSNVTHVS